MENSFQTSFIPKKPITSTISDQEPRNFFSIITTFLLVASIIISGLLFVYKIYLTKQEETLSASLTTVRDSFEKGTIDELDLFNRRTESAKQILSSHIVLSPLFSLLGDITVPQIQYTSFEQTTDENGFLVNMKGVARDYKSIAIQSDVFNSDKGSSLKNVLFSDLTKDKNNNITFNLKFNVSPELLSYENSNLSEQPEISNPVTPTVPTTTTIPATTPLPDLNNQTQ